MKQYNTYAKCNSCESTANHSIYENFHKKLILIGTRAEIYYKHDENRKSEWLEPLSISSDHKTHINLSESKIQKCIQTATRNEMHCMHAVHYHCLSYKSWCLSFSFSSFAQPFGKNIMNESCGMRLRLLHSAQYLCLSNSVCDKIRKKNVSLP